MQIASSVSFLQSLLAWSSLFDISIWKSVLWSAACLQPFCVFTVIHFLIYVTINLFYSYIHIKFVIPVAFVWLVLSVSHYRILLLITDLTDILHVYTSNMYSLKTLSPNRLKIIRL